MKTRIFMSCAVAFMLAASACKVGRNTNALVRAGDDLIDRHWTLVELSGFPVSASKAYLVFGPEDTRVSGNSGCNDFSGNYRVKDDQLTFSNLVSTQKMCIDMDVEKRLTEAFQSTGSYAIHGDTLILGRSEMMMSQPLAKFKAQFDKE